MGMKREEQKNQRRALILRAALDLFIRKGYGETKIADIAKSADMSMGLLFHYFDSKEKLYEELIRVGCAQLKLDFPSSDVSPLSAFRSFAESIFDMIASNPPAAKMFVLMENAQHLDILPNELKEMLSEAGRLIEDSVPLILLGQERGEIRKGDPEALAVAFWCSIQGIAQHIALYPETRRPDADMLVSILKSEQINHET